MYRAIYALGLLLCLGACHGRPTAHVVTAATPSAGDAFLASNAKAPGVVTLPSGLQYKVLQSGPAGGVHPGPADEVKVNYEGKLISGQVFDSSFARVMPADMPLSGLIPGWIEALQLMRPGDDWMLYVPAKLAYGDNSPDPSTIPQNSVLIFRIQLLGVLQHPQGPALG
jgi:peptidylprolyl isomerase/FKBP-type peptidyl-prolyl cis-trans isomerase FklB